MTWGEAGRILPDFAAIARGRQAQDAGERARRLALIQMEEIRRAAIAAGALSPAVDQAELRRA